MVRNLCAVLWFSLSLLILAAPQACLAQGGLTALNDNFTYTDTQPHGWSRLVQPGAVADHLQSLDIGITTPGRLTMVPNPSVWFQGYRGELTYKQVTGDFVVSTSIHVTNRAGTGVPTANWSLAGLMVRAPQTGGTGTENYVFMTVGCATTQDQYQLERKSTTSSASDFNLIPAGVGEGTLQIARVGNCFLLLGRPQGGDWYVIDRIVRADMPATVQVGMICYTDWPTVAGADPVAYETAGITGGSPDLIAQFDYVRFQDPAVLQVPAGDLSDPTVVSDLALIGALGDNAIPPQ